MPIYTIEGRRPSKAQIVAKIKQGLQVTNKTTVVWGENELTVERRAAFGGCSTQKVLDGHGWIGPVGGQDLAAELQKEGA